MAAEYSKGKAAIIGIKVGPKDAKDKNMSNLEKLKTRLTQSPWRWIMTIVGLIVIVIAVVVVPIVVTIHSKGERTGTHYNCFCILYYGTIIHYFNLRAAKT